LVDIPCLATVNSASVVQGTGIFGSISCQDYSVECVYV
jgi:hypothetical protein